MGIIEPIIGYSRKITELTSQIQKCDDDIVDAHDLINSLNQHKTALIGERDTVINVLKEFLSQPISMAELDDDM